MIRQTATLMILGLLSAGPPVANAETVRTPATGDPAVAFDAPAGWSAAYDKYGHLLLATPDKKFSVMLAVVPAAETETAGDQAVKFFQASGLPLSLRTAPGSIGGKAGDAFFTEVSNEAGAKVNVRLDLVRVDPTHFAVQLSLTPADVTAEQTDALQALLQAVRLTAAP